MMLKGGKAQGEMSNRILQMKTNNFSFEGANLIRLDLSSQSGQGKA